MLILLLLSLVGLLWTRSANAQTPEDFFHFGAQAYIAEDLEKAKAEVAKGLSLSPEHPQLRALEALLNQEQQNQDSQENKQDENEESKDQEQQEQRNQENKDQNQKQDQQNQEQSGNDQQENQEGQEGNKGEKDEKNADQPAEPKSGEQGQEGNEEEENQDSQAPTNSVQMIHMNPEEAKRLLDSIKGEEKTLIFLPPQVMTNRNRNIKNW